MVGRCLQLLRPANSFCVFPFVVVFLLCRNLLQLSYKRIKNEFLMQLFLKKIEKKEVRFLPSANNSLLFRFNLPSISLIDCCSRIMCSRVTGPD